MRLCSSLFVLTLLGVCGCGRPTGPDSTPVPVPLVRLRSEPFSFLSNSGFIEPQRLVVRDAVAWQGVWETAWRSRSEIPPLPEVDFTREMVVVAALGSRPSGGFSILVDSAAERPGALTVSIRTISPGNCIVTLAVTQPLDMARLPRRGGAVFFREQAEVRNCS